MAELFKPFVDAIKGIHWLAAGPIAFALWFMLWHMVPEKTGSSTVPIELAITIFALAFAAALLLTVLALDGLVKWAIQTIDNRRGLERRRQTIRNLRSDEKFVLFQFLFARRRTLQKIGGTACDQLADTKVLESL